jgi:hypothetical protein
MLTRSYRFGVRGRAVLVQPQPTKTQGGSTRPGCVAAAFGQPVGRIERSPTGTQVTALEQRLLAGPQAARQLVVRIVLTTGGRLGRHNQRARTRIRHARRRIQARVLSQYGGFQDPKRRARIEPELLGKRTPQPRVHRQRVGLPAAAIQGEHQLPVERFAERVLLHERLQIGRHRRVLTEAQPYLDKGLDTVQPQTFNLIGPFVQPR